MPNKKDREPDWIVDLARQLHEEEKWGFKRIAKKLEVSPWTVREWIEYKFR